MQPRFLTQPAAGVVPYQLRLFSSETTRIMLTERGSSDGAIRRGGVALMASIDAAIVRWRARRRTFSLMVIKMNPLGRAASGWYRTSLDRKIGREILRRTEAMLVGDDHIGWLADDTLAVLCEDIDGHREAERIAKRLLRELARPLRIDSSVVGPILGVGVAVGSGLHSSSDDVLSDAQAALECALQRGVSNVEVFDEGLRLSLAERFRSLGGLLDPEQSGEFAIATQPIVSPRNGNLVAYEVLLRPDVTVTLTGTEAVVSLAEATGHIDRLGSWVLDRAARLAPRIEAVASGVARLFVNVSGRQLTSPDFVPRLERVLEARCVHPGWFGIEITESIVVSNGAIEPLERLRELGLVIALDDFGSGYANLSALDRLPLDLLKLDKSIVRNAVDGDAAVLLEGIVDLAHALGIGVVAEGVESQQMFDVVRAASCDLVQGYHIGPPITMESVVADACSATGERRSKL